MSARKWDLRRLLGVTGLVLGVMVLNPGAGWLVRSHVQSLFYGIRGMTEEFRDCGVKELNFDPGPPRDDVRRLAAVAAQHPDDYALQLGAAVRARELPQTYPYRDLRRERLLALVQRYPRRPEIYAHMLRYMTTGAVVVRRREEFWLENQAFPPRWPFGAPRPEDLALFYSLAQKGERLDPNNAYFPLMRCVGLFGAGRDHEALESLARAGSRPRYDDYAAEDAASRLRLAETTYGHLSSLERMTAMGGVLLPHLAQFRAVARVAVALAAAREAAGRPADGTEIRHQILRCGSLLRSDSSFLVGSAVGIALEKMAIRRPGGLSELCLNPSLNEDQREQWREAAYRGYLLRHGFRSEAAWMSSEFARLGQLRDDSITALDQSVMTGKPLWRVITWWVVDLAVLTAGAVLLLAAGVAGLRWRNRNGILPLLSVLALLGGAGADAFIRPFAGGPMDLARCLSEFTYGILGARPPDPCAPTDLARQLLADPVAVRALGVSSAVAIPLILLLILAVVALWKRRRSCGVLLGGLRGPGAVIGCLLLLLYAVLLPASLAVEASTARLQDQSLRVEGRVYFQWARKAWPPAAP